jgi:hypothetical protein
MHNSRGKNTPSVVELKLHHLAAPRCHLPLRGKPLPPDFIGDSHAPLSFDINILSHFTLPPFFLLLV